MKRVSRLLAAIAALALAAALIALGPSPAAAISPNFPASVPGIEYTAEPGDGAQRSSNGKGAAEMPTTPDDPIAPWLDDCLGSQDAKDSDGRVYNRFKWCKEFDLAVKYYKTENGKTVLKGVNQATYQAAGLGYNDSRATRTFFRIKPGTVRYTTWSNLEKLTTSKYLKLEISAECVPGSDSPGSGCAVGRSPAKMEWDQWNNFGGWVYWDVSSAGGKGEDFVAFHKWRFHFDGTSPGWPIPEERGETGPVGIRCDSGNYFKHGTRTYPHACIYTGVEPVLTYKMSENPEVGQHIRDAQNAPDTTWPKEDHPKKIPGKWNASVFLRGEPLHRVASRYEGGVIAKENEDVKQMACGQKRAINPWGPRYNATTGLPPYAPGLECDEYPFSSTHEGAADPEWDFSVRAVSKTDNGSAGSKLVNFYTDDRILMFLDDFWVDVVDA
ncbi:NucA/NucB deoxyribonuclease domain-containing protein [Streptomyces sp. WM6378]|uniref:NucA/NucB deoxyribonuclease domain-containing protein n=1 Tax=Streptomyces sp. WM6378 TaxID=1415557 RepID=UPI000AECE0D6|nr:NucA/NucB deoxyribonuclease domain-containing protein [Streptomyces sp. WM6378]